MWIPIDFSLFLGVYPFSACNPALQDVAIGTVPFTFRVVTHCTDNIQHGLLCRTSRSVDHAMQG